MNCDKDSENLDVEKIVTSNDLINILEDDYHSQNMYSKKMHGIDNFSNTENLNDAQPANINEYIKQIASITFKETYENYINCMV